MIKSVHCDSNASDQHCCDTVRGWAASHSNGRQQLHPLRTWQLNRTMNQPGDPHRLSLPMLHFRATWAQLFQAQSWSFGRPRAGATVYAAATKCTVSYTFKPARMHHDQFLFIICPLPPAECRGRLIIVSRLNAECDKHQMQITCINNKRISQHIKQLAQLKLR